ncbi:MAG: PH domain-containing protein [Methylophilaceae bacterium]|nr:PH domain-containing protein [Methylophilaceae bacterium]
MNDETKACPVCAERIKLASIKCRYCNADLIALAEAKEAEIEKSIFTGHPVVIYIFWQWLAVFVTLGIAYLYYWIQSVAITYEITTQRVKIERGILSKDKDSIELFRIDHFELQKPLGMRLIGQCILHLRSSDTNFPSVTLRGIPNLESLADTLRECSLRERTRRQVTTFVQA